MTDTPQTKLLDDIVKVLKSTEEKQKSLTKLLVIIRKLNNPKPLNILGEIMTEKEKTDLTKHCTIKLKELS